MIFTHDDSGELDKTICPIHGTKSSAIYTRGTTGDQKYKRVEFPEAPKNKVCEECLVNNHSLRMRSMK